MKHLKLFENFLRDRGISIGKTRSGKIVYLNKQDDFTSFSKADHEDAASLFRELMEKIPKADMFMSDRKTYTKKYGNLRHKAVRHQEWVEHFINRTKLVHDKFGI